MFILQKLLDNIKNYKRQEKTFPKKCFFAGYQQFPEKNFLPPKFGRALWAKVITAFYCGCACIGAVVAGENCLSFFLPRPPLSNFKILKKRGKNVW